MIEQMIQRMLECPRQPLPRQIDGQEPGMGIDGLVAGHGGVLVGEDRVRLGPPIAVFVPLRQHG